MGSFAEVIKTVKRRDIKSTRKLLPGNTFGCLRDRAVLDNNL